MKSSVTVKASGRINIIGEHTDYNDGFVLPASIDKKSTFKIWKNGSPSNCSILSKHFNQTLDFDLTDFAPYEKGWQNYVMGVVAELQKIGANLQGFDGEFDGTVPIGSGMSSSAALECSLAVALNELFELGFDEWQLIKAAQMAEHNFVGIKCGIMDQFASIKGKKDKVVQLDCRTLEYQYFPFDLGEYQLLLLNTNVEHSLASSAYNNRREACERGVEILKTELPTITKLRDVTADQIIKFGHLFSEEILTRCKHVVTENERVKQATTALINHDLITLGNLMYASHNSLQHDYEVSCPELDYLVEFTKDKPYILGGRMMGGGFGGCTINIIKRTEVQDFITSVSKAYQQKFGFELTPYEVNIEDGIEIIHE